MLDYEAIKYELELTSCEVHGQHPKVTIQTDDKVSIACCCEEFQQKCSEEFQEALANQVQKSIMDAFNNGLKDLR